MKNVIHQIDSKNEWLLLSASFIPKFALCLNTGKHFFLKVSFQNQYFKYETDYLENKNLFQKSGVQFLVETIKIQKISFPY